MLVKPSIPSSKDFLVTILFGLMAIAIGLMLQVHIPGMSVEVSFFEIPLLISIFYLVNPLSLLALTLLSSCIVFSYQDVSYASTFISHIFSLTFIWYVYQKLKIKSLPEKQFGVIWFFIIIAYYCLLLIPLIILYKTIVTGTVSNIADSYSMILSGAKYELLPSALVSSLYLVQHEYRRNLEQLVNRRTKEISKALEQIQIVNSELLSSNEEVRALNENLEKLVTERTLKVNKQFDQLKRYVDINAHEVRAPLARILGLLGLIKIEKDSVSKLDLLQKIYTESEELDSIIKRMNLLLESEVK